MFPRDLPEYFSSFYEKNVSKGFLKLYLLKKFYKVLPFDTIRCANYSGRSQEEVFNYDKDFYTIRLN